jgi:hypothetical protein
VFCTTGLDVGPRVHQPQSCIFLNIVIAPRVCYDPAEPIRTFPQTLVQGYFKGPFGSQLLAAVFPSCGESLKLTYKKRMNKKEVKQDPEP